MQILPKMPIIGLLEIEITRSLSRNLNRRFLILGQLTENPQFAQVLQKSCLVKDHHFIPSRPLHSHASLVDCKTRGPPSPRNLSLLESSARRRARVGIKLM